MRDELVIRRRLDTRQVVGVQPLDDLLDARRIGALELDGDHTAVDVNGFDAAPRNNRRANSAAGRSSTACSARVYRSWPIPVSTRLVSKRTTPARDEGFSMTVTG